MTNTIIDQAAETAEYHEHLMAIRNAIDTAVSRGTITYRYSLMDLYELTMIAGRSHVVDCWLDDSDPEDEHIKIKLEHQGITRIVRAESWLEDVTNVICGKQRGLYQVIHGALPESRHEQIHREICALRGLDPDTTVDRDG